MSKHPNGEDAGEGSSQSDELLRSIKDAVEEVTRSATRSMSVEAVGDAKRFLMERYDMSAGDALDFLVEMSWEMGISVQDVAVYLIQTEIKDSGN